MDSSSNLLLARLPERELRVIRPHLEPVILKKGEILGGPSGARDDLYFVEAGVLCTVAHLSARENVGVALTGREGVGNAVAVLGRPLHQHQLHVLIPGTASRLKVASLHGLRRRSPLTADLTESYVQVLVAQMSQSAICNRYHLARRRLAGWLLMIGDCAETTRLPVTHRALAQIVGGARSLVTTSLAELREQDAIDYRRSMVILKRRPLLKQACECYETLRHLLPRQAS